MSDGMTDQLVLETDQEGEKAIHNLLVDGPGSTAIYQGGVPLKTFLTGLREDYKAQEPQLFGLVPPGMVLRSLYQRHGLTVFLIEVPPSSRTLRWLRDDSQATHGPKATYQDVHIALPYQYFFVATTWQGEIHTHQSVYFLNQPLRSLDEQLGECHYYNCSVDSYGVHCWVCTQNISLPCRPRGDRTPFSTARLFIEWFFASGFNASSEHHEGKSFWTKNKDRLGDIRVDTINAWEAATVDDANFILQIPWRPSLTAQQIFEELTVSPGSQPQCLRDLIKFIR